jgi:phosphotransferase system enzyme I (PtsP)
MRTLDVGGDKPLPYLAIEEDNPFLGWRGIRFTLDHPEIFLIQVRAMLKASIGLDNMDILLPMISGIAELDESKVLIERAFVEVAKYAEEQGKELKRPRIGIMIEVPSILYQLSALKGKVDFISVGSNDLTQYLLAVDRNNSRVASVYDALHPAVLHAMKHIIDTSRGLNIPVSVCGELAGDPIGALLLVGMGYRSLSMNTRNVARIKYILRHISVSEMEQLSRFALQATFADDVRAQTTEFVDERGLGGFIRAGK